MRVGRPPEHVCPAPSAGRSSMQLGARGWLEGELVLVTEPHRDIGASTTRELLATYSSTIPAARESQLSKKAVRSPF